MKKIKEVIVVEAKDDTKQIQRAVDADRFETNGSALSLADIEQLKKLQQTRGLIIFTDPDFNGERLRKMISQAIPGVKHAFIRRDQGIPTEAHGSLGVEHASQKTILHAVSSLYTEEEVGSPLFRRRDMGHAYLVRGRAARQRRERLAQLLGIGYGNGKQMLKRLNLFRVTRDQFDQAIAQMNQEEQDG